MDDVKRILVVSRSTKNCKKALHYGISLAKQFNSKLYVLHVIHDPFSLDGWNLPVPSLKQEYENYVQKAREEMDRIIKSAIISTHEEGRLEHFLFGGTVEGLIRKMPCSVLVVNYKSWHQA
jgi:universal stress protein A